VFGRLPTHLAAMISTQHGGGVLFTFFEKQANVSPHGTYQGRPWGGGD